MFWLWLTFAVVIMVGSLMAIMPSRRQRQIAALRNKAIMAGLKVQRLSTLGSPFSDLEKGIAYVWLSAKRLPLRAALLATRVNESWEFPVEFMPYATLLEQLPKAVSVIGIHQQQFIVVWAEEAENNEDVAKIADVLKQFSDQFTYS